MSRTALTSSVLAAAISIAAGMPITTANAAEAKAELVKCYGINAIAKNDCAAGAHSCAGQATKARDKASFVLVPAGACEKIDGGSQKPV